jgi:hypothetical protein
LSNERPDVAVSANGGPEHFNTLYNEHLRRKLLDQMLNGRDETIDFFLFPFPTLALRGCSFISLRLQLYVLILT